MNLEACLSRKSISEMQILLCCVLLGFTYVGQKQAANRNMDIFNFTAGRFLVSTLFLYSVRSPLQDSIESDISDEKKEELDELTANRFLSKLRLMMPFEVSEKKFHLYFWSITYGTINFIGNELLQIGMMGTSAGKSAFIVGLNVVFIQIMEVVLPDYNSSLSWIICGATALSVIGLYFLSGCFDLLFSSSELTCSDIITSYDIIVFLSMLCFGTCVLLADAGSSRTDCIDLICLSFLVSTVLCIFLAIINDPEEWLRLPSHDEIFSIKSLIIAYTGIAEVAAVTAGTLGQMYVSPTRSAMIMSLEATSSAILAYLLLHEVLSLSEIAGCCLMFSATIISTTVSIDEGVASDDNEMSLKSLRRCIDSSSVDFEETSDFLEKFLKTKQRSHRSVVLGRRARALTYPSSRDTGSLFPESLALLEHSSNAVVASYGSVE